MRCVECRANIHDDCLGETRSTTAGIEEVWPCSCDCRPEELSSTERYWLRKLIREAYADFPPEDDAYSKEDD